MLTSMTGYGRGETKNDQRTFTVEMKSINHRYSDIFIRMPKKLSVFEERIKKMIKGVISRGKVEVYISLEEFKNTDLIIKPNIDIIKQYYNAFESIKNSLDIDDKITLSLLTSHPDTFKIESNEENEETLWEFLKPAIEDALNALINMRKKEGLELSKDIQDRGLKILEIVKNIEKSAPIILKDYRNKLFDRINEITEGDIEVDENRLALELSIYADKSNITEEIVRLYSHLDQLEIIIKEEGAVGRKLDFLIQEMNREINTIGSKSVDVKIANNVIEIKSELEKIREQVQNIE